jgi:PAS domain S-box-containing protein
MIELSRLLAVNGYLPHGYCINWSPQLMTTFFVSDVLIFLAYFSMPVALAYFARRRRDFPYRWLLWMFAAFIMACGGTHLMGAIVLWQPLYGLDAALKAVTALVSVATAVALWPLIPHALKLPSPDQLRRANEELQGEIAERKRVEEALRLAKEAAEESLQTERILMAAIVESSEDAIIGKAPDGIVTSWNRGAEKIFGYAAEDIVGRSVLALIPPERHDEEAGILAAILRGEPIIHFETERVRKNGSRIDVSITTSPIRDKDGRIIGASKIARDITERKKSEAEVRQLNAELEQRVALRTVQLEAASEELAEFSYSMSHDMGTPLRAIDGYSKMLLQKHGAGLDDEAKRLLQVVRDNAQRMGRMIDDILRFLRIAKQKIEIRDIDIGQLARQAYVELQADTPRRRVHLEIGELPLGWGDREMLRQVMLNLLSNAIKFSPPATDAVIELSGAADGKENVYAVKDHGVGFDMRYVNKLFRVFERVHPTGQYEGTGIGLAIVKCVVDRHGGRVWADGSVGEGATFHFTLPRKRT